MTEHVDVLIVGAGISGISAAYHLQRDCPGRSYAILEGRAAIGGTWDLFRYPGIRSDSDMHTLGYSFRPWTEAKSIADGPSIRSYVVETATQHGIDRHIRFGHRAISAEWSTADALWTVTAEHDGAEVVLTCGFLFMCSGYYDYAAGYTPDFPGREAFTGRFVHPQHWPADLDHAGKRVVVIGSGATAVARPRETGRPRHHAAALAYLCRRPARRGRDREPAPPLAAGGDRLRADALEERAVADVFLPHLQDAAGEGEDDAARRGGEGAWAGL